MTKEARICNGEDSLFNKWCWENWTAACKRMKLEPFKKYTQNGLKLAKYKPRYYKTLREKHTQNTV